MSLTVFKLIFSMRYNALVPELGVLDISKSLHFYTEILPFKVEYSRPETGFAFLSLGEAQLMLEQMTSSAPASDEEIRDVEWRVAQLEYPLGRGLNLSIAVKALDEITMRLRAANYPLKMEEREKWYRRGEILTGERAILVMDPDGYLLRFQQRLGEKPLSGQ